MDLYCECNKRYFCTFYAKQNLYRDSSDSTSDMFPPSGLNEQLQQFVSWCSVKAAENNNFVPVTKIIRFDCLFCCCTPLYGDANAMISYVQVYLLNAMTF